MPWCNPAHLYLDFSVCVLPVPPESPGDQMKAAEPIYLLLAPQICSRAATFSCVHLQRVSVQVLSIYVSLRVLGEAQSLKPSHRGAQNHRLM